MPRRVVEEGSRLAKELEAFVGRIQEARLREAALAYPRAGGKALRPALAVLACEAAGGRVLAADPLALAVELLHTFSLVHDDLMDRDDVRRGVPTVHKAFDEPTAILAGDALFALAFEALGALAPSAGSLAVVTDVAATARLLCEGQMLDMAFERRWPDVTAYERMIHGKTAALFACATANGARVAGANERVVADLGEFGRTLGLAFQIQDDVLDLTTPTEKLGKPQGSDVMAGKKTHPLIRAREAATPKDGERLERILAKDATDKDIAWVLDLCRRTGAIDASLARADELFGEARAALARLPRTSARAQLAEIVDWVAKREK